MNESYLKGISSIIQHGFWFVDIPRTSSSSVRIELGKRFGTAYGKANLLEKRYVTEQIFPDHITALEMSILLGEQIWNKLFTFSIVRNPWDRTVSIFNYRKIKGNIPVDWDFYKYVTELKNATPESKYFSYHGFRLGAIDYLINENNEIIVDFILRFEKRREDLITLSKKIGTNIKGNIKTQEASPKELHYSNYYNNETKDIIKRLYAKDIETFKYRFDSI